MLRTHLWTCFEYLTRALLFSVYWLWQLLDELQSKQGMLEEEVNEEEVYILEELEIFLMR